MYAPPFDVFNIVKLRGKPTQPFLVEVHHQRVPARHLHRISRRQQDVAQGRAQPVAGPGGAGRAGPTSTYNRMSDLRPLMRYGGSMYLQATPFAPFTSSGSS